MLALQMFETELSPPQINLSIHTGVLSAINGIIKYVEAKKAK
jgi:hypothetical protein